MSTNGAEDRVSGSVPTARILIADDEAVTRTLLDDMLRAEGYTTIVARDGAEALQLCSQGAVDLLLLDVIMPAFDGFEVCRRIKDEARLQGKFLPVIFLTALSQRESRLQGLALGADDYLTKPFHRTEVLLRVRGLLSTKLLYDDIVRRYQNLERLEELQRRLTAFVVHDFKNPLTGLMANLQLLERELQVSISPRAKGFLQDARGSAKRLYDMVGTLLDISRMEEGALKLRREPLQLSSVFQDSVEDFQLLARAKDLSIELRAPSDLPPCHADQNLVTRILQNLVANAVRHSPRGKKIIVNARHDEGSSRLLLSVIDEATRIAPEHRHLIFQKFGRIEVTGAGQGHGLGLTFCRLAAQAHGGDVYVQEAQDAGNEFIVALPLGSGI
jgi:signal transduction histidine kinase